MLCEIFEFRDHLKSKTTIWMHQDGLCLTHVTWFQRSPVSQDHVSVAKRMISSDKFTVRLVRTKFRLLFK